jgi:hypothetical protein
MGDRNRTYLSQGWTGVDGKQIVRKNGSCGVQLWAGSLRSISLGVLWSSAFAWLTLVMSCAGLGDLTPRRGLVYDANGFEF